MQRMEVIGRSVPYGSFAHTTRAASLPGLASGMIFGVLAMGILGSDNGCPDRIVDARHILTPDPHTLIDPSANDPPPT